ncbi:hypothetical protein DVH24_007393 [Malus domestica]|uniref:Uncharacterized protein n=1 Tax=Malus domestica TaxID=3750 RepID=A0A498HL76_MALDO|nr:hypothetical protein DVH24_007393 [Malus domestica]
MHDLHDLEVAEEKEVCRLKLSKELDSKFTWSTHLSKNTQLSLIGEGRHLLPREETSTTNLHEGPGDVYVWPSPINILSVSL